MLFIRRYIFPGVLALGAYLILSALWKPVEGNFLYGAVFTFLLSYLIRIFDDICDYEKDLKENKALLSKKTLIILGGVISAFSFCGCVFLKLYILLLPLVIISSQFFLRGKLRTILKLLFVPSILTALFLSVFEYSVLFLIPAGICVLIDIAIILKKVASNDSDK